MPRTVIASEIIRRSDQGVCEPFFVRDTGDDLYVVKGVNGVGASSLVSELICAELGQRIGLPIPEYALMEIPEPLIQASLIESPEDLGGGPAFASKLAPNAALLSYFGVDAIPEWLQQRVLVFDKWVCNGDRKLTARGGNVNLLTVQGDLRVIDHNAAFDMVTGDSDVIKDHVFCRQGGAFDDLVIRAEHKLLLDSALGDWGTIIDLLPDSWVYPDPYDDDRESQPTLDQRFDQLNRIANDTFWSMI